MLCTVHTNTNVYIQFMFPIKDLAYASMLNTSF